MRDALVRRLARVGLELHPGKTRIVYGKDDDRAQSRRGHVRDLVEDEWWGPRLMAAGAVPI